MIAFDPEDITLIASELEPNLAFRDAVLRIIRDLVQAEGNGDVQQAFGS